VPRLARLRSVSWFAVYDVARTTWAHFSDNVSERDRKRVAAIIKRTKGDPRQLTVKEKADLRAIGRRLKLGQLGRDLMPFANSVRKNKRKLR
jgi:hypothetical protein